MTGDSLPRLDRYHFYEEDWSSYEALRDSFQWEIPDTFNTAAYLCDRWAEEKSRVALFAEDEDGTRETYTFWQLRNHANRFANFLADRGVEKGDRVGLNTPTRPETLIAHLGTWKLGAVSVPLSTLFGPQALQYRLEDANAKVCVVDESNIAEFRQIRDDCAAIEAVLTTGDVDHRDGEQDFHAAIEAESTAFETLQTDPEDPFVQIYTSGTTGKPKGAVHPHRVMLGHLPGFVTGFCNMQIDDESVVWGNPDWAWQYGLLAVLGSALFFGIPVVGYNGGQFDPRKPFELIERYGVTTAALTPSALRMMRSEVTDPGDAWNLDSARVIASGGESLSQDLVDWVRDTFDSPIHNVYGQTEINLFITDCTDLFEQRLEKLGKAVPGHEVAIVDQETGEPTVPRGEVGEIAIRYEDDPVIFDGYWNNPEKTREKLLENGWGLTEDLGKVDDDGYIEFIGRKNDAIISSGYTISPDEIEDSLASHEAVLDAGVIGASDDERGEVPVAFVELVGDREPSEELKTELQGYVKENLAKYQYPRQIHFIDELPRTTTGKVQRFELEKRAEEQ